ncbi:hypothetical protein M3C36_16520 [Dietzia cinnamea]|uniref:hypothetical protein n=1 Tax=Dietzia TaxID=37914 RepID=UPI00157F9957|nr:MULTISPECIES: hypothetical protein [Dietzia]MCT1886759.1 hypothetical protein [Dietzia cinnamea]MCT2301352.1 hypothetical protein [Dietzia cinnamea]
MDPITLAIIAGLLNVGPAVGGSVAAAGPAAAAIAPAAASIAPAAAGAAATAPIWVPAAGTGAAVAAGAGSLGAGSAVASNPVAAQGAEAWFNDINNQAVIGSVEANNFVADGLNPHLPPEHQIPKRTIGY